MVPEITNCLIVGGNGQVGRMFASKFVKSGIDVVLIDIDFSQMSEQTAGINCQRGDITKPDEQIEHEIAQADLVLLAVPEHVALSAVPSLITTMHPGALLVDTLSVKSSIVSLMQSKAQALEIVSLNPMFAPSLEMAGRPIAMVTLTDGPRARALRELLVSWEARIVPVEATDHDRLTAALQVATHSAILAFGLALRDLGIDITNLCALAPPPHLTLLALLARIVSGVPEVYWDIQAANPEASAARTALRLGIQRIETLTEDQDMAGFVALLTELQTLLGSERTVLSDLCVRLFRELPLAANTASGSAG